MKRATLVLALCSLLAAPALAALKPYQSAALEEILATMPAPMREAMRPQLEMALANTSKEQVRMLMEQYAANADDGAAAEEGSETTEEAAASPEDHAWNRTQIDAICARAEQATLALRERATARQQELVVRYEADL